MKKDLNMNEEQQLVEEHQEVLLKSKSGLDYTEHKYVKDSGEEGTLKLFRVMNPERLSEETHDEYRLRRRFVNKIIKVRKQGRLSWDPYPFGKGSKGLSNDEKGREFMETVIKQLKERKKKEQENKENE